MKQNQPDKQAIEDELFIDGGKHVIACFKLEIILNEWYIYKTVFRIIWRIVEIAEGC